MDSILSVTVVVARYNMGDPLLSAHLTSPSRSTLCQGQGIESDRRLLFLLPREIYSKFIQIPRLFVDKRLRSISQRLLESGWIGREGK